MPISLLLLVAVLALACALALRSRAAVIRRRVEVQRAVGLYAGFEALGSLLVGTVSEDARRARLHRVASRRDPRGSDVQGARPLALSVGLTSAV